MIINSDNEKLLDYLLERKNIQKEKEKDSIISKQQKDLISLSKEFIRLSKENSELRMTMSLKHEVEIKLKDAEFSLKKLEEQNKKLILDSKYLESKLNQKIDKVLLEKQYEKLKMEQNETLYMQKMSIIRQIEMENEIYKEEVQNLKRQIEILKSANDSKIKQIEIEYKIKYAQLKEKMMDNLNEAKIKLSKLNLKYLDNSNRVSLLQNYQLLMELEEQKSKNEELIKDNENLQKKLLELKSDINIHQKVEVNLASKIQKEKNKNSITSNNHNDKLRASSALLLLDKKSKMSLINEKLKKLKENDKKKQKMKYKSNSFDKINKKQIETFINKNTLNKENYINLNENNKLPSTEERFNIFTNYMQIKKNENEKLNHTNEILKLKIAHYEQKYRGLFNFLEESLDKFYQDAKNNIINIKAINIDFENLKTFNFKNFSNEEQYSLLVLLMNYLTPLIYPNFNVNFNVSKNNIFATNLNIIDRSFNKAYNYLNDKLLKRAFIRKNNKLSAELYMDKKIKNNFGNIIPILKRNNSSKLILDKKSKLLI